MTNAEYFASHGLSNSGMKDLAVSPLRYWYLHLNPNRPEPRESPEIRFGSALHCAVLEPDQFSLRYARQIDAADFAGCLVTMDDLRVFLGEHGIKPKGTRKADLIGIVQATYPDVPILDVLQERHEIATAGKIMLSRDDWSRVENAADAVRNEPIVAELLRDGQAEVPMFATHPETGVRLRARMDWVRPDLTLDLKSFGQQRGKSVDRSVTDAIYYERYHDQAYFYSLIRSLQPGFPKPGIAAKAPHFINVFIESSEPFEVRVRSIVPLECGSVSLLWDDARSNVTRLIRLYAECAKRFGDLPWRDSQELVSVSDQDIPALAYKAI